jgi:hypothetical protein
MDCELEISLKLIPRDLTTFRYIPFKTGTYSFIAVYIGPIPCIRAIYRAFSLWPLTAESGQCGICGEQSDTRRGFSLNTSVFYLLSLHQ